MPDGSLVEKITYFEEEKCAKIVYFVVGQLLLADLRYLAGDFEGCGYSGGVGYGEFYSTPEFDALEQEIKKNINSSPIKRVGSC